MIESLLLVEDPDLVKIWMKCFSALAKTNKLEDKKLNGGENEITDFLFSFILGNDKLWSYEEYFIEDLSNRIGRIDI